MTAVCTSCSIHSNRPKSLWNLDHVLLSLGETPTPPSPACPWKTWEIQALPFWALSCVPPSVAMHAQIHYDSRHKFPCSVISNSASMLPGKVNDWSCQRFLTLFRGASISHSSSPVCVCVCVTVEASRFPRASSSNESHSCSRCLFPHVVEMIAMEVAHTRPPLLIFVIRDCPHLHSIPEYASSVRPGLKSCRCLHVMLLFFSFSQAPDLCMDVMPLVTFASRLADVPPSAPVFR